MVRDDNTRAAYVLVGVFFAVWYAGSMVNCAWKMRERAQLTNDEQQCVLTRPAPIVAASMRTFQNRPFNLLLPAWTCAPLGR